MASQPTATNCSRLLPSTAAAHVGGSWTFVAAGGWLVVGELAWQAVGAVVAGPEFGLCATTHGGERCVVGKRGRHNS